MNAGISHNKVVWGRSITCVADAELQGHERSIRFEEGYCGVLLKV